MPLIENKDAQLSSSPSIGDYINLKYNDGLGYVFRVKVISETDKSFVGQITSIHSDSPKGEILQNADILDKFLSKEIVFGIGQVFPID